MSQKIRAALEAADTFLTALCVGRVPPCFTPKNEAAALGVNAAAPVLRVLGPALTQMLTTRAKLVELRDVVKAALVELDAKEGTS